MRPLINPLLATLTFYALILFVVSSSEPTPSLFLSKKSQRFAQEPDSDSQISDGSFSDQETPSDSWPSDAPSNSESDNTSDSEASQIVCEEKCNCCDSSSCYNGKGECDEFGNPDYYTISENREKKLDRLTYYIILGVIVFFVASSVVLAILKCCISHKKKMELQRQGFRVGEGELILISRFDYSRGADMNIPIDHVMIHDENGKKKEENAEETDNSTEKLKNEPNDDTKEKNLPLDGSADAGNSEDNQKAMQNLMKRPNLFPNEGQARPIETQRYVIKRHKRFNHPLEDPQGSQSTSRKRSSHRKASNKPSNSSQITTSSRKGPSSPSKSNRKNKEKSEERKE